MRDYTIKTERLFLRPITKDDAEMLWPYVSNPDISKNMSWHAHQDISETQAFIDNTLKSMKEEKTITWCIFLDNKFCGIFSLISILRTHRSLTYDRGELAYWIAPQYEGQGIMTEAGKRIIDLAFKELKLNKLVVGHHINNSNSEKLILRLGFKFLYEEEQVFMKNNVWIDCKFYDLKAKDYFKNPL